MILLDISRLVSRLGQGPLTGIDRVERAWLEALKAHDHRLLARVARRQLLLSLRERALRAEADQELHQEQARVAERTRIAREMHDVLAHRISLLALHAGGLEVRPDLPAEQVQATAALLRATAFAEGKALADLALEVVERRRRLGEADCDG